MPVRPNKIQSLDFVDQYAPKITIASVASPYPTSANYAIYKLDGGVTQVDKESRDFVFTFNPSIPVGQSLAIGIGLQRTFTDDDLNYLTHFHGTLNFNLPTNKKISVQALTGIEIAVYPTGWSYINPHFLPTNSYYNATSQSFNAHVNHTMTLTNFRGTSPIVKAHSLLYGFRIQNHDSSAVTLNDITTALAMERYTNDTPIFDPVL